MEAGAGTPFLDLFKRSEVDREIRLMVARGELGLRPHEQLGLLELLVSDPDQEVADAAALSLRGIRGAPIEQTSDVPADSADSAEPQTESSLLQKISAMTPPQKLALAMRGTREERTILIRDSNKMVAVAVLSSPKMTETEVEGIAKMANVPEDLLRIIGHTRAWMKNYVIVSSLTRNPKTPVAVSLHLLTRLQEKDIKNLANDRNIPDVLRLAARRRLVVQ